jgi:FlaG/FlaF family flagellin (archaellin)
MRSLDLNRRLATGATVIGAAVVLASCGGGGSTSSADFQSQANQVCRDAQQQFDRIVRTTPRTADQAEKQAAALVDVSNQALDDLHRIKPPDQVKTAYTRYLDSRQKAIGYIEDARAAAADNNGNAYARAKRQVAATQPARRQLALAAGLHACSVPTVSLGGKSAK